MCRSLAAAAAAAMVAVLCVSCARVGGEGFLVGDDENVILFGDSITADGTYGQIMQDLIDRRFPDRRIRILARGSSGDTVHRSFSRVETGIVPWRPSWVLVNLGVNDRAGYTAEQYLRHYERLIHRIRRDTGARIAVVSPIYLDLDAEDARLREYVRALPGLARKHGALYVPLYETIRRLRPSLPAGVKYAVDGTHPNRLGYWMFAQTLLRSLGFPLDGREIAVPIPSRRLTAGQSDTLAGRSFTVALPSPLRVTVTNPPLGQVAARRADKPIVVDGKLGEWDLDSPILLGGPDQRVCGVVSWPRDHFAAMAHACYDEAAWYFAIVVDDSVVRNTPSGGLVERDCVELCLDLRSPDERAAAESYHYSRKTQRVCQYILSPATADLPNPAPKVGGGDLGMLAGVKVASSVTRSGYVIEFSVPAARFPGGKIQPGMTVGFDFAVNNVDRFSLWCDLTQFRWSGSPWSFFSTREFGKMTFIP